MELKLLKAQESDVDEIMELYKLVIKTTFTTWDENYPDKNLILSDIKNGNLFVLKDDGKCIAVSFLGKKEKDDETWSVDLKRPLSVARICVSPKYQGKGVGTKFMAMLVSEAKNQGADGMHFHVCTKNPAAMKMYEKNGFKNYGQGKSNYGFDYYKYEQKF